MDLRVGILMIGCVAIISCSATDASSLSSDCDIFTFEDDVTYHVKSDAVRTLSAYDGWFGAPKQIVRSMEIEIQNLDQLDASVEIKALHLSAFFRPLQDDRVECQVVQRTGYTRCYADLSETPLQLSAVFDLVDEAEFDAAGAMHALAERVKKSALDCP
jgi:hypothetical protein